MSEIAAETPRQQFAHAVSKLWWLPLVRGILLIAVGGYALLTPGMTMVIWTQVIGFFLIADGLFAIIAGITGKTPSRLWTIVRGVLGVLFGGFVFAHPVFVTGFATITLIYFIAFGLLLSGVMEIFIAIRDRKEIEGEGWMMLCGLLAVIFGILMFTRPLMTAAILIQILGAYAIIFGIALIVLAFRLRKFGKKLPKD